MIKKIDTCIVGGPKGAKTTDFVVFQGSIYFSASR